MENGMVLEMGNKRTDPEYQKALERLEVEFELDDEIAKAS